MSFSGVVLRRAAGFAAIRAPAKSVTSFGLKRANVCGSFGSVRGFRTSMRLRESIVVNVPTLADSITEGELAKWAKNIGDYVHADESVATVETDKVDIEINSPHAGIIEEHFAEEGDTIVVGDKLFKVKTGVEPPADAPAPAAPAAEAPAPTPAAAPAAAPPKAEAPKPAAKAPEKASAPKAAPAPAAAPSGAVSREETRVKMTRMRSTIAKNLKDAQNTYALLTTFNEVDMSNLMNMRNKYKDAFLKKHGVKLGFMSAFVAASTQALKNIPTVNAHLEGNEIVYRDYVDISVAVSSPKGLVVPVLRNCNNMNYADIEKEISNMAVKARDGSISIEDMAGGTFTISNGGVFGSLMGTPIVNAPQSAILGMHGVFDRPVAVNGEVVIRPMMYIALTYDHRIIDGREAVTFLKTIKECVEDPMRLMIDL
eukprot:Nk52_evm16s162 gene=Nk52_evmTU16s162